ncbi:MAG: hypothetical protein COA41_20150 [Sphingopyxis sp.]|nr:MAG: hypothetical protein COA41_20150 [Sphingopyxis sp.]
MQGEIFEEILSKKSCKKVAIWFAASFDGRLVHTHSFDSAAGHSHMQILMQPEHQLPSHAENRALCSLASAISFPMA